MNDWISVFLGGRKMVLSLADKARLVPTWSIASRLGGQGTPCPYNLFFIFLC